MIDYDTWLTNEPEEPESYEDMLAREDAAIWEADAKREEES
jgi:hypothetical protein